MKNFMRIGDVARELKLSVSTVRRYANEGKLEHETTPAGQRVFTQAQVDKFLGVQRPEVFVFYVRSSKGSRTAMDNQEASLREVYGEPLRVYRDAGSGLNENRKALNRLMDDLDKGEFTKVHVTYKDRLTRFGQKYLDRMFLDKGVEIVPLYEKDENLNEELMSDFMDLIASFSGRLYRMRSKENQKKLLDSASKQLY